MRLQSGGSLCFDHEASNQPWPLIKPLKLPTLGLPRPLCKLNFIDKKLSPCLDWSCVPSSRTLQLHDDVGPPLHSADRACLCTAKRAERRGGRNQETFSQRSDGHTEKKRAVHTCVWAPTLALRLLNEVQKSKVPINNAHSPACCTLHTHRRPGPPTCACSWHAV